MSGHSKWHSLKLVLFGELNEDAGELNEEEKKYFAKNGETGLVYIVSPQLIENIFDLEFKSGEEPVE